MKRFYKLLSLMLSCLMLVSLLTACANSQNFDDVEPLSAEEMAELQKQKEEEEKQKEAERIEKMKTELSQIAVPGDVALVESMTTEQLDELYKKKKIMFTDFQREFQLGRVNATVDAKEGTIAIKSKTFFHDVDNTIASEGYKLLDNMLPIYAFILYYEKYDGFISDITVDYHGEEGESQALCQSRLNAVMAYCRSNQSGISGAYDKKFIGLLKNGQVYAQSGDEDAGKIIFKMKFNLD